jgi:thiamine-phosphate pyrophosphorylase
MLRYAITDGCAGDESEAASARWAGWARLGVEFVLVREKRLEAGVLARLTREVVAAVGAETRVLVAGRVDVALAAGAGGVHLSARDGELSVGQVLQVMPRAFVSVSCHTLDEVRRAREDGASAVLFGPVFGKTVAGVEVVAGVGLGALREACKAAGGMPVFALGGVSAGNAESCVEAGAAGVAGIRMFAGAP